ncbi:MAG: hypothetical protein ABIP49_10500 [Lysobacterales bacterium]
MRTTLDIADDVLAAAKEIGRRQQKTAGMVLSDLARHALTEGESSRGSRVREPKTHYGFAALPARGVLVTNALIDRLREDAGD